jgi:hypothetical protein
MQADALAVNRAIQRALAYESSTELCIESNYREGPLTVIDARCIFEGLRQTPRCHTLSLSLLPVLVMMPC